MVLMAANMAELKTIKITETAHRGLQIAKVMDGIKQQEWVSAVILEALEKDCPNTYKQLREEIIREQ